MPDISPETLTKLQQYDTPTICNVIELFDVRPRTAGYMNASIQANFPEFPPIVGFAATATCRTAIKPASGSSYQDIVAQVERFGELSGTPIVVFQDLDAPITAATFGEIMCSTYQSFGAGGLITSGAGRDLEQVKDIGFQVFTGSTICSHGYIYIPDVHIPVHVGGISVYPNDLLHGDLNGVTTIPHEIATELADVTDAFVAAEKVVLDAVRTQKGNLAALNEAIAEKDTQVAALVQQIRGK